MLPRIRKPSPRGSALLLVVIILGVLAMLGATALQLAQQESTSVNQRINYQTLVNCAEAAERKLWSEVAVQGVASGATVKPTVIPGTNARLAVGHFDSDPNDTATVSLDDNFFQIGQSAASGGLQDNDATNTIRQGGFFGQPYMMYAHCTDSRGRKYEVELMVEWM